MIMEFSVGRAAQASPIKMYQKLEKKGQKWHIHGYVSFFGSVALMAFYTVVTGWIVYYFVRFLTGNIQDLGFSSMITNPGVNVTYLAVTVVLAFGILCFGLQGGLERVTKYMMMLLLVLTSVLGYELKTAVGTSVFIMTFTALTGAISHFYIGGAPDIPILIACVISTLVFAQIGAKWANGANVKMLNRMTGILLCALGVVMLFF